MRNPALLVSLLLAASMPIQGCDEQETLVLGRNEKSQSTAPAAPRAPVMRTRSAVRDEPCEALLDAPPRGLACLQCTHQHAENQFRQIVQVLRRSCLKNIAANFLVDGTFGAEFGNIEGQLDELTSGGRRLFLHLYLSNGPSQRLWKTTPIEAVGTRLHPSEFRQRIIGDYALQYEFQSSISRVVPLVSAALSRGVVISVVPMLEDNLSDDAFAKLHKLASDALPQSDRILYGRNPCGGCFHGNENGLPSGLFLEVHTSSPHVQVVDGVITNDGTDYEDGSTNLSEMAAVRDAASMNNNMFILWSAKRQGLGKSDAGDPRLLHPDKRDYRALGKRESFELEQFLRGGL